jgi:hypothetical protein
MARIARAVVPGFAHPITQRGKKVLRKLKPGPEGVGKVENEKVLCPPDY